MSSWFHTYGLGEVAPHLYVGAHPLDGDDVAALQALGVERVLNLVQDAEYPDGARERVTAAYGAAGIAETRVDFVDFEGLPADRLSVAVGLLDNWLEHDQTAYVHCRAGWQRSAAVAAGAVAVRDGVPIEEALALVRARKPTADPLPHQKADLAAWWQTAPRRA